MNNKGNNETLAINDIIITSILKNVNIVFSK